MDLKKYISDNFVHADKLLINKNTTPSDIYQKLNNFYKNNYIPVPIKINDHEVYINKEILKPLIEELKKYWNQINIFKEYDNDKILIDEIFHSLSIESIQSSRKIIKSTIKNEPSASNDQLLRNIISSFITIENVKPKLNESNLNLIYTLLTTDIDMGNETLDGKYYREDEVKIGNDMGVNSCFVYDNMKSLFNYINSEIDEDEPVLKILITHLCFELIHPYYDMNGRTGRILAWWMNYVKYKQPNLAYFSTSTCHFRDAYLKAFKETKKLYDLDLTYGVATLLYILITQAKNYLIVHKIENYVFDKHKANLNTLQKSILMQFLAHKEIYNLPNEARIKVTEIWKHFKDFSQQIVYRDIQKLENYNVFVGSTTNPKQIKANFWDKIKTDSN